MELSNAIMAGMSRAGTTFMYHNLQKHPDIFIPSRKEIGFFAHNYHKGTDWYNSFFEDKKDSEVSIDICGVYFTHDEAINRMKNFDKDTKIILSIRNPYEWIYTFYEQYSNSFDMPPFKDFVNDGCDISREGEVININYTNEKISKTIEEYMNEFKGRIMLYDFSYFEKEPLHVLKSIEDFLEIDDWFDTTNFNNQKINAIGRKHSRWFDKLLQKKGVVDLILKIFPKSLILFIREKRELSESKQIKKVQLKSKYTPEEQEMVKKTFYKDNDYITNLFKTKPIIKA